MQFTFQNQSGEVYTVDVKINYEAVARRLAPRAKSSKSGKSKSRHGAIVCKLIAVETNAA